MQVYVGQARGSKLIRRLLELGIGECTNRGEYPPVRTPWFLDNGAFSDWTAGIPWNEKVWVSDVDRARGHATPPDFAVTPDMVGMGADSLSWSREWLPALEGLRAYLAVQDGMTEEMVDAEVEGYAGIFVGGTLPWKLETGGAWCEFAHSRGLPCHIGRVGTEQRVRWAIDIEADSIDSSLPLFSEDNLKKFLRGLQHSNNLDLFR